jgi:hypothetical protein
VSLICFVLHGLTKMCLRVRTHVHEGHPDFIVTADSWPAFLYPYAEGDLDNVERGLFRSAILLKVCVLQQSQDLITEILS